MRPIQLLSLIYATAMFGYCLAQSFFAYFASAYLSQLEISSVFFAIYVFFALVGVFSGQLVERFGTTRSMKAGLAMYLPFLLVIAVSRDFLLTLIAASLVGVGAAIFWNAGTSLMLRLSEARGGASAMYTSSSKLGTALSGLVGGIVVGNFFSGILALGMIFIAISLALMFLVHDARRKPRHPLRRALSFFGHGRLLSLAAFMLVLSLFGGMAISSVPLVIKGLGGTALDVGVFGFLMFALAVAATVKVGNLSDTVGRRPGLYLALLLLVLCALLTWLAESTLVVFAVAIIYSVASLLGLVLARASIGDMYREDSACANAVVMTFGALGTALGALLPALAAGRGPYLLMALAVVPFFLLVRRLPLR